MGSEELPNFTPSRIPNEERHANKSSGDAHCGRVFFLGILFVARERWVSSSLEIMWHLFRSIICTIT